MDANDYHRKRHLWSIQVDKLGVYGTLPLWTQMTTFLDANDYFFQKGGFMEDYGLFDDYGVKTNIRLRLYDENEEYLQRKDMEAEQRKKKGCLDRIDKNIMKDWIKREKNYFYFSVYNSLIADFPECEAIIFRFLYLCSYGDYDGYLGTERRKYNKKELCGLLMLSDKRAVESVDEMVSKGLLIEDGGNYLVNNKYYIRGKLDYERGNVTRVFNNGIQELYKKSQYNEHKMLAHFVPLMPYMNVYYNVLCHNPDESDIKKIQALSLKEVADLFGVDKSNSTRLRKKLVNITVNNYYLLGYFYRSIGEGELKCFIVNPYVFCKAPKISDMTNITNLFDMPDNEL